LIFPVFFTVHTTSVSVMLSIFFIVYNLVVAYFFLNLFTGICLNILMKDIQKKKCK
jgi:hypothetical protein